MDGKQKEETMNAIRTENPPRTASALALAAAVVLAGGCSGEIDLPGEGVVEPPETDSSGGMQAVVTDDPASGAPSSDQTTFTGTLTGRGDVEVSTDEQTWYTMGATREFTLPLQDDTTVEMTEAVALPVGTYRYVRINFAGVESVIEAGSTVDGRTLERAVHLRLGDTGNAVTAQEVDAFELGAGSSALIVLDLNSERWVNAENLERRQIPKAQFEERARIEIVGES